jgi:hypothetical protein
LVRAGRKPPVVTSQIGNQADPTTNITVNTLFSGISHIPAPPESAPQITIRADEPFELKTLHLQEDPPPKAPEEDPEFPANPKLKRVHTNRIYDADYTIDCDFLKHVIAILISHYNIQLTRLDVQSIVSYFGEVAVKTKKQKIKVRDVDAASGSCGGAAAREEIVELIKKVSLNGLSIAKHIPDLLEFLKSIGISF